MAKTLTDWTDEQCSRWIAEKVIPQFCGTRETKGSSIWGYSCVKCGMSIHEHPGGLYAQRHMLPDMVNDPAMTLMLEHKINCEIQPYTGGNAAVRVWIKDASSWYGVRDTFVTGKRGRAVAEAFMLVNGWREE